MDAGTMIEALRPMLAGLVARVELEVQEEDGTVLQHEAPEVEVGELLARLMADHVEELGVGIPGEAGRVYRLRLSVGSA